MKVGIVGGIGPESTIDYYRSIISAYGERRGGGRQPSILINSIDLNTVVDLVTAGDMEGLADFLAGEIRVLAAAGADFAVLAANTPHVAFDAISGRSPIPLISIVRATCDAAKARGFRRLGLIGTRFTMRGGFYQEVFEKEGMTVVVPQTDEQDFIHEKYMGELVKGVFLPATRDELLASAGRFIDREGVQGLILGGTELPLILRDPAIGGVPLLDTTRIHVDAIVARLLA
ncbi:MAG: amino acid racemase [Acidobacteriota bacterium]|nr:amino acid racemase [Acidobacteriota bacterium]